MSSLSAANTKFCVDFFKELSNIKRNENIFFSPLSISVALSMVHMGARGNTAKEMEKHEEAGGAHSEFQELLLALGKAGEACSLSIANKLFGERTFRFLQQYSDSTRALYPLELEAVDFINASEQSRRKINSWVEKQTGGKIKDMFPHGAIDGTTVLALVNAIYFKGQWHKKFKKESTREMPFRLNKREHRNVQMMCRTGSYKLVQRQEEQMTVLELPYTGKELSMFILLPEDIRDESTGLEQLENSITYEKLAEWTNMENVHQQEVAVYLPRFRMEDACELKPVLQILGVRDAFILEKADFSGLSREPGLFLSKAIHKSFVEVNEEGTEAAAATGLLVIGECYCIPYKFRADHPFLFLIKHNPSKNILFFGRCCSP